jgi:hypothetical protein
MYCSSIYIKDPGKTVKNWGDRGIQNVKDSFPFVYHFLENNKINLSGLWPYLLRTGYLSKMKMNITYRGCEKLQKKGLNVVI